MRRSPCHALTGLPSTVSLVKFLFFQKKKPDWALGAKEGEGGARPPSEGPQAELQAELET